LLIKNDTGPTEHYAVGARYLGIVFFLVLILEIKGIHLSFSLYPATSNVIHASPSIGFFFFFVIVSLVVLYPKNNETTKHEKKDEIKTAGANMHHIQLDTDALVRIDWHFSSPIEFFFGERISIKYN
jgi:hypothetical protein